MRRIRILLIASAGMQTQTLYTILGEGGYQTLYIANIVGNTGLDLLNGSFRPDLVMTYALDEDAIKPVLHYFTARGQPSLHVIDRTRHTLLDLYHYKFKQYVHLAQFVTFPDYHADMIDYIETMVYETRQDVDWLNRIYDGDED